MAVSYMIVTEEISRVTFQVFFGIMLIYYGLPIHLVRSLWGSLMVRAINSLYCSLIYLLKSFHFIPPDSWQGTQTLPKPNIDVPQFLVPIVAQRAPSLLHSAPCLTPYITMPISATCRRCEARLNSSATTSKFLAKSMSGTWVDRSLSPKLD